MKKSSIKKKPKTEEGNSQQQSGTKPTLTSKCITREELEKRAQNTDDYVTIVTVESDLENSELNKWYYNNQKNTFVSYRIFGIDGLMKVRLNNLTHWKKFPTSPSKVRIISKADLQCLLNEKISHAKMIAFESDKEKNLDSICYSFQNIHNCTVTYMVGQTRTTIQLLDLLKMPHINGVEHEKKDNQMETGGEDNIDMEKIPKFSYITELMSFATVSGERVSSLI